jgi:MYXO-CTERM domain-containing protein
VTDADPGDDPHSEVVVSGHPTDIGMGNGVGGVAPMACQAIQGAVSFAFPETYGDDPIGICEAAGQESAHAFGLDHELLCSDIMTYQFCGAKSFVNEDSECGEFQARPCACGGEVQNSHEYLLEVLGAAAPLSDPPVVTITRPNEAGQEVEPGFRVTADVTDPDGTIIRVELHIDGELVGSRFEEPWAIDAPDDLALGPHDVEVIAFDDTNAEGTSTVSVMVVEDDGDGGGRRSRGCSTGGAPSGGLAAVLLLFALALKRRRGQ